MSIIVTSNDPKPEVAKTEKVEAAKSVDQKVDAKAEDTEEKSALAQDANETADESETSDTEEKAEEVDQEAKPKKSKNGFKRRIDKLNSRLSKAEQDAQYWREVALSKKSEPAEKEERAEKVESKGKPSEDDFNTHAEYVEALTDWKVDQREQQREAKQKESQVKTEFEKIQASHQERVKAFAKAHDDFEEVMEEVSDFDVSPSLQHLLLSSDLGPDIMYDLAQNIEELERINALPPMAAAKEIGKIEKRLEKSSESNDEKSEAKTTKAPKPIKPVSAGGSGGGRKSLSDPNITQAEYEAIRREQMKSRSAWG